MYIDSYILIYSALDNGELGGSCRNFLDQIIKGKVSAASSYLVLDEVLWILQKEMGKEDALKAVKMFLSMPVKWIDVKREVVYYWLNIYSRSDLDPRDALHLATMKEVGLTTIVTEDKDFEDIEGIQRIDIKEWKL